MPRRTEKDSTALHYRKSGNSFRVWRDDWSWDSFVVFSSEAFQKLRSLGFRMVEHDDDED